MFYFPNLELAHLQNLANVANTATESSSPPSTRTLEECDAAINDLYAQLATVTKALIAIEGERRKREK